MCGPRPTWIAACGRSSFCWGVKCASCTHFARSLIKLGDLVSAHAGGLLCASCASSVPGSEALEPGEPAWLASLISMRFDELAATPIDPYTAARLLGFSHVWAATHLDCRLRAFEFLLGR